MFERYTEKARRVIFFARYEASVFGSNYIEPEHLLLALLRDSDVPFLSQVQKSELRTEVERELPRQHRIATSVDLPLSHESKRILAYAAEEAERLKQQHIRPEHLVAGILRSEDASAPQMLIRHGITIERVREFLMQSADTATRNQQIVNELKQAIERMSSRLTYEIEPAVIFSLKQPAEPAE